MNNSRYPRHIRFIFRLIGFTVLLAIFVFFTGSSIVQKFLPLISAEVELFGSDYEVQHIAYEISDNVAQIRLRTTIHRPFVMGDGSTLDQAAVVISQSAYVLAIPFVIAFSLILAVPDVQYKKRLKMLAIALPLVLLIMLLDVPMIFLYYLNKANPVDSYSATILNAWFAMLTSGGRQFLSIVAALIALAPLRMESPRQHN